MRAPLHLLEEAVLQHLLFQLLEGEGSQGPAAAAIANAIAHATGKRLRALPFAPERVKQALA